ncbi:MAG: nucleotide exchange factor GrpE [Desulfovibrio sp.]|nr:nucleotide exchange factor GrpE [Desulfovibrio sp.]
MRAAEETEEEVAEGNTAQAGGSDLQGSRSSQSPYDDEEEIPVRVTREEDSPREDGPDEAQEETAEEGRNASGNKDEGTFDAQGFEGEANYQGPLFGGTSEEPGEIEALKAEIENLRLRQAAEMENFKKRLAREHEEQLQYAAGTVLSDLLPTLDNLELAMQYGNTSEVCKDLLQGVSMTHKLLLDAVQKHGLVPVGEAGENFDPQIHEAVGFDSNSELEAGKVSRVLQRGYKLGKRLLRAAKVMITQ